MVAFFAAEQSEHESTRTIETTEEQKNPANTVWKFEDERQKHTTSPTPTLLNTLYCTVMVDIERHTIRVTFILVNSGIPINPYNLRNTIPNKNIVLFQWIENRCIDIFYSNKNDSIS